MQLITNRNNIGRIDNMDYYLKKSCKNTKVKIAVAFFTDYKLIESLLANGCSIDLICRLKHLKPYIRKAINIPKKIYA